VLELRCSHVNGTGECGRYLAKLEGGYIVIRCPLCKAEQRIALAELVLHHANEAREMERVVNGDERRLIW
jgi:phage FluMu protein Com